jgi:superfamily II DNA or RNA helicase
MLKNEQINRRDEILSPIYNTLERENWILYLATGFGKTKAAIDWINKYHEPNTEYFWFVPTTTLRDVDIPNEFKKWNVVKKPNILCYSSSHVYAKEISKIKDKKIVLILDEAHRITDKIYNNIKKTYNNIIMLTATKPRDLEKEMMLKALLKNKNNIIAHDLNQSADDKIIADFEVNLIPFMLNDKNKYISAGNKKTGKFLTTERKHYNKMSSQIENLKRVKYGLKTKDDILKLEKQLEFLIFNRTRFIYGLPTKINIANKLINNIKSENKNERILVFGKLINQIETITHQVYHSKTDDKYLKQFNEGKIDLLASVDSLNEGKNIPEIETAIVIGLDSNYKNIIQRLGRICRFKEDKLAKLYIIYSIDTQEKVWVDQALSSIAPHKIKRWDIEVI